MTIFNPKRADHQEAHLRRAIYQPNRAGAVTAVEKRWARDAAVLALYTDQLHYTDRTWQKLARDDCQVQRFLSVNDHHGWIDLRPYSGKVLQYPGKADTWVPDKRSPTKGKWVKHETKLTLTPYGEPELIPIDLGVIIAPDGSRWSLRFDIIHGKPLRAFELHKLAGAHRFGPLTLRGGFPGLFPTAPRPGRYTVEWGHSPTLAPLPTCFDGSPTRKRRGHLTHSKPRWMSQPASHRSTISTLPTSTGPPRRRHGMHGWSK